MPDRGAGVYDSEAQAMFDAASHELQAARDAMPSGGSLSEEQRARLLEALAAVKQAAQQLRKEVSSTIR